MTANQRPAPDPEPRPARGGALFIGLIEPPPTAPARWHGHLRLLAGLLLPLLALSFIAGVSLTALSLSGADVASPSILTAFGAFVVLALAYAFARTGRYYPAALLTVAVTLLGVLAPMIASPQVLEEDTLALAFLVIPVVLGGLLLPLRYAGVLAGFTMLLAWTIHDLLTEHATLALLNILVLLAAVSFLVLVGASIRDRDSARLAAQSRALAASTRRFTSAFNLAADGMALLDLEGNWVQVNRALAEMFGYDEAGLLATPVADLVVADDRDTDAAQIAALLAGEIASYQVEKRGQHRQSHTLWILLSMTLLRSDDGDPQYFIAQYHDISQRKAITTELQTTNTRLTEWLEDSEQRTREIATLNEMSELLQACTTAEEAYRVVADLAHLLFPDGAGAICSQNASRTIVETMATWGEADPGARVFGPDDCWALRRGRAHVSPANDRARRCGHLSGEAQLDRAHLCLPLTAQGEPLGLLHLSQAASGEFKEASRRLAQTVADSTALALANLRLRESLRSQSVRDMLTGLYNRRYLEETLEREVRRAARASRALGVIMLDIDHFKQFNDTFSHAAGDAVLRSLGDFLQHHVRGGDIACRLGGEEFVLILPEASLDVVQERAATVQSGAHLLSVDFGGQTLGRISVSAGIAVFPEHGNNATALLEAADAAMYQAKREGRNRVVTFT